MPPYPTSPLSPLPAPRATQLPLPNAEEIKRFQGLYRENVGVDLDSATAAQTLADLAQFYFLTRGHERFRLLRTDQSDKHAKTATSHANNNAYKL